MKNIDQLATDIYEVIRNDAMSRALASLLYDKGWRKQIPEEPIEDKEDKVESKDFYTAEEVRNMSRSEVSANLTAIRKSMARWRQQ